MIRIVRYKAKQSLYQTLLISLASQNGFCLAAAAMIRGK
jgi:hypothetical protein